MQATKHMQLEWELIKWLAIVTLAAALAMTVSAHIASGDPGQIDQNKPQLLPREIDRWAQPMKRYLSDGENQVPTDAAMRLWVILDDQQSGRTDRAIEAWNVMQLPLSSEVWRHVGLAQAYLAAEELDAAADALHTAEKFDSGNALIHYYTGLLRLKQADKAPPWYDAPLDQEKMRIASLRPFQVAPNTPGMYKLSAMIHLVKAIEFAPTIVADQPLVPEEWPTRAALGPTVGDLLLALGDERFEAFSHLILGRLHLENEAAEQAEFHLDRASDLGLPSADGYDELGNLYQRKHRHLDAFRVYLKGTRGGEGVIEPLQKAFENLRKAVEEID